LSFGPVAAAAIFVMHTRNQGCECGVGGGGHVSPRRMKNSFSGSTARVEQQPKRSLNALGLAIATNHMT